MKKKRSKYNAFTAGKHRKRSRVNYRNQKHAALTFFRSNTQVNPLFDFLAYKSF